MVFTAPFLFAALQEPLGSSSTMYSVTPHSNASLIESCDGEDCDEAITFDLSPIKETNRYSLECRPRNQFHYNVSHERKESRRAIQRSRHDGAINYGEVMEELPHLHPTIVELWRTSCQDVSMQQSFESPIGSSFLDRAQFNELQMLQWKPICITIAFAQRDARSSLCQQRESSRFDRAKFDRVGGKFGNAEISSRTSAFRSIESGVSHQFAGNVLSVISRQKFLHTKIRHFCEKLSCEKF